MNTARDAQAGPRASYALRASTPGFVLARKPATPAGTLRLETVPDEPLLPMMLREVCQDVHPQSWLFEQPGNLSDNRRVMGRRRCPRRLVGVEV
jgi:hypothetical protein